MTREQLLRYAQLTGGMLGRQLALSNNSQYTLDKVYWAGNTYVFIFNVDANIFSYKQNIKLTDTKALCDSAMSIAREIDPDAE